MSETKKKTKSKLQQGGSRRSVWLLVVTLLLIIASAVLFMPPSQKINQGLDIQGGLSVVLSANSTSGEEVTDDDMEASRSIIENRVNALGASEATVQIQGNNQILVQIPGLSDTEDALQAIGRTGQLEFARLDSFTDEEVREKIDSGQYVTQGTVTDDYGNTFSTGDNTYMEVEEGTYTPIVTGSNIKSVSVSQSDSGLYWAVDIELDSAGKEAFAEASRDLVGDHGKIVILLDHQVNSAPAVQSEITDGRVQITGNYTQDEANALKTVLQSGSLPVSFTYNQSQTVGPTLGQNALTTGVLVAAAGLLIVMLYLLFFYRGLGLLTAAAMAVFACIYLGLLAFLSHFGLFSLSLAGIAGIVLTIGMAADSSILTLERFREEIRMGRSVRAASMTGVEHGIRTSIDADLVTLVSAVVLFFLATSGVKGFGLTLGLGVICDIVMMLLFKAPIIRVLAPRMAKHPGFWGISDCQAASKVYKELADIEGVSSEFAASTEAINSSDSRAFALRRGGEAASAALDAVSGLKGRFIKHDINFLKYRKVLLTLAAIVTVVCIGIIGIKGLNYGIEFVGGTSTTFTGTGDVTTEQIRQAFEDAGEAEPVVQTTESNGEAGFIVRTTQSDATAAAATAAQVAESVGISSDSFQIETIGPDWGTTIIKSMAIALLVSFILIALYIAFRFEYKMGLTALVALLHDIILVVGIYALVGREMNPNTIAALLTILGYSLYDTVVVFHRISENMKNSDIKCTFMTMANHSINQVFTRSINTSLTSLFPVVAMLLFGSETLQDFAFAMTIGLISGCYSSIAIACPLFAIWKTREPENAKLVKKYGTEVSRFEFEHGALVNGKQDELPEAVSESVEEKPATANDASELVAVASEPAKDSTKKNAGYTSGAQAAKAARKAKRKTGNSGNAGKDN